MGVFVYSGNQCRKNRGDIFFVVYELVL